MEGQCARPETPSVTNVLFVNIATTTVKERKSSPGAGTGIREKRCLRIRKAVVDRDDQEENMIK